MLIDVEYEYASLLKSGDLKYNLLVLSNIYGVNPEQIIYKPKEIVEYIQVNIKDMKYISRWMFDLIIPFGCFHTLFINIFPDEMYNTRNKSDDCHKTDNVSIYTYRKKYNLLSQYKFRKPVIVLKDYV